VTATIEIHELDVMAEADWSFNDSIPRWRHSQRGSIATFDPFPAYPHPIGEVREAVAHVLSRWEPSWHVDLYSANREAVGRTNGFSNMHESGHYEGDQWVKDEPTGLIMMSGKRIPPHPAMTRYLVAHEYGHNVEWMINAQRGAKYAHDNTLIRAYAEMRGVGAHLHLGEGGTWHNSAAEVFACDFRIVVCEVEVEFWPHHGIPRPEEVQEVWDWWNQAAIDVRAAA
jgi:hypothetical protein